MFIAVEGCTGSGKTTIAKQLASERGSALVLEDFQANPFLKEFYPDPSKYVLETELAFVLIHYHQVFHEFEKSDCKDVVSDYYISKDLLFAKMNFEHTENLRIFENLYTPLSKRLPSPDVVICLRCSNELILQRIRARDRDIEQKINEEYFIKLNALYGQYFEDLHPPQIDVDMNERDFLKDPSQIKWLSRQIDEIM